MHLWGVLYTESMAESRQISDGLLAGLHDPAVRREAFDAVVEAWLRPLYWHVRRLVVVHEDAEDVVQESFVKAYDALDSFRGVAAELRVWLYRIATRTALSLLRRRRRGLFSSLDDVSRELADRVSEECGDAAEEALVRFQQAVLNLPLRQRLVFNLRYYDGLSYAEIARILQQREPTLRVNYHHAVEKLKQILREE